MQKKVHVILVMFNKVVLLQTTFSLRRIWCAVNLSSSNHSIQSRKDIAMYIKKEINMK